MKHKTILRIGGISGIALGTWMLVGLQNKWGLVPLSIGFLMVVWRHHG